MKTIPIVVRIQLLVTIVLMASTGQSVHAVSSLNDLYQMYSPENQFPLGEACHQPVIKETQADGSVPVQSYKRSEHDYFLPPLPVVSTSGDATTLDEILKTDKPVFLTFIYTTCSTICPVLSATFYQVQDLLGEESKDVSMVSITIDPEYDSPEVLEAYSRRFAAGPQWEFYTGELNAIIAIERAFNAYRGAKMNHDPLIFIRANGKAKWIRLDGVASAEDVVREYRQAVMEQTDSLSLLR